MEHNKKEWNILSKKIIYDNAWISLIHHEVINPAGNPGIYGKVHFKNVAIGILPLEEDNTLHLIGQYRFVLQQYSIEIPEGGGAEQEDPLIAAKRELLEEAGLTAERWDKILEMHMSNSVTDEFCIVYLARNLTQGKASPEETEKLEHIKIPFDEAYQMVLENKITDAISVAAILKLRLMQLEGKI
jgi:8-oxo-dGTP pyrophosphatase MutT (NUDIX family)